MRTTTFWLGVKGLEYYNAGEMGDIRLTWQEAASLAQSHRGEEEQEGQGRRLRANQTPVGVLKDPQIAKNRSEVLMRYDE